MEKFPHQHEASQENHERLKEAAAEFGQALIQGNLVLPQTYAGIKVYGAEKLFSASEQYGITPNDLLTVVEQNKAELSDRLKEAMLTAHRNQSVSFGVNQDTSPSNLSEHLQQVFSVHTMAADVARENVSTYSAAIFPEAEDIDVYARQFTAILKTSLLDTTLREKIRIFQNAAAVRGGGDEAYADIQEAWKEIFLTTAAKEMNLTPEQMDKAAELFDEVAKKKI